MNKYKLSHEIEQRELSPLEQQPVLGHHYEEDEDENDGVYSTNEVCIFSVNVKKYNKKFLQKFFIKNYGKVVKVRMIVEQSRFPNAVALIRFEDAHVAQQLVDLGKISFSIEKDAPVHKIKRKKRLNKNQKNKKKKKNNNTGAHSTPININEQQQQQEHEYPVDKVVDTAQANSFDALREQVESSIVQETIVPELEISDVDSINDDTLSTAASDISCVSESDIIDIKKKKPKRRSRNSKPNAPQTDFLNTIMNHKDVILSYAIDYTFSQHDRIASELTKLLFDKNHEVDTHHSNEEDMKSEVTLLNEALAMYNFLLFMNIMPNRELTSSIMDECVQLRAKCMTLHQLPKIGTNQNIDLLIESKSMSIYNSDNNTTRYLTSDHPLENKSLMYTTGQYRLKKEIDNLIEDVTQTKQELYHNKNFLKTIERVCAVTFKEKHSVNPYGSSANGFSMRGSDIDLALNFDDVDIKDTSKPLKKLKEKLKSDGVHSVKLIGTRIPILKIHHFNVECDVCVNNYFAVINTKLLYTYSRIDKRLKEVVHVVKYWARSIGVNDSSHGTLSSYSYALMVIFYFQMIGILPSLQMLVEHESVTEADISYPQPVQGQDCRFVSNINVINKIIQSEMKPSNARVTELVIGFFEFYKQFDFNKCSICIKTAAPVLKLPYSKEHLISIIDPFEYQRDLGCVISSKKRAQSIIQEFCDAADILSAGGTLCDVNESSVANQFGSVAKQWDTGHTFRRYPSPQALEKILNNKNFADGTLYVESLEPVKAYVVLASDRSVLEINTIGAVNRALHLDYVFVKKNTATHGQVVTVLEKVSPQVFACVADVRNDFVWMKPIDSRYPKMITTAQFFAKSLGCKQKYARRYNRFVFACQMDEWKENERYPQVHSFEVLGCSLDPLSANRFMKINEEQYMLAKQGNHNSYPTTPRSISSDVIPKRPNSIDETSKCVFTISDHKIKSTAFAVEKTTDGMIVSLYIVDVNNFITTNGEIDYRDFWGIHFGRTNDPVIDQSLIEACNFEPHVERSAICVSWAVKGQDFNVSDVKIYFCNIKSICNLDSSTVEQVLALPDVTTAPPSFSNDSNVSWETIKDKITLLYRGTRSTFPAVEAMKQFRLVYNDCSGVPTRIDNVRDAQQLVKLYQVAANRLASSHIQKLQKKDKYFLPIPADEQKQHSVVANLERLSSNLLDYSECHNKQINTSIHHTIIDQILKIHPVNESVRLCAEYLASKQFNTQSEWRYTTLVAPVAEFTSPAMAFTNLFAHRMLEAYCKGNKEEVEWDSNEEDIESMESEIHEFHSQTKQIEEKAYYHNLSAYLYHYCRDMTTEAVVIDGNVSSEMELALFLPKFGLEMKCSLTQLQPHPSRICINEKTNLITLHYGEEKQVELRALSTIRVDLTVDYDCYPNELIVNNMFR
jgi:DNA polymerase sigma